MSYPAYYKKDATYTAIPFVYNTATGTVTPASAPPPPPPPGPQVQLKVVSATATASETGNGPENVLDTSETTRWSAQGVGKSLSLDLGGIQEISQIDITWYQGTQRQAKADILVDNTKITSITSDGVNPSTRVTFPARQGKTVTIVGNGNNLNDWNSITTVKVFGKQLVEPGPIVTPPPPPPPPPPPTTGMDKFGIKMLNPTVVGGREFYMPSLSTATINSTNRIQNTELVAHGQGSVTVGQSEYIIKGEAPRLYCYDAAKTKIWDNVEITCYYKIVSKGSAPAYSGMELAARSNHHISNNPCDTYYSKHKWDGTCYFMKEKVHPTAVDGGPKTNKPFAMNAWYGMKFVLKTQGNGSVLVQQWRDETDGTNGGNWIKLIEHTDSGSSWLGSTIKQGNACFVRTDGVNDFRIKKWSIRTI